MPNAKPSNQSLPETTDRRFKAGYAFPFFNAMTWKVVTGSASVLLAEQLGGSIQLVGAIYSFVFLLAPLQIAATFLLPKFGYKRVMILGLAARSACILPMIYVAFARPEPGTSWALHLFAWSIFLFCVFRAIAFSGYMPWMYGIFDKQERNRFYSGNQLYTGLASLGILVAGAGLFRFLESYKALTALYTLSFVGACLGLVALSFLDDAERPEPRGLKQIWTTGKKYLFRPSRYRNLLWMQLAFVVVFTALYPFSIYYLKVVKQVSNSDILTLEVIQAIGVMATSYAFKKPKFNLSPRPVFIISLIGLAALAVLWSAVLQGLLDSLAIYAVCSLVLGVVASLWYLSLFNYQANIIRKEHRPMMLAFDTSAVSLATGLSAILWGTILKGTDSLGNPSMNIGLFQIYFLGVFLVSIGLIPLAARIKANEFDRKLPFRLGYEIMRPFRAIAFNASAGAIPEPDPAKETPKPRS